ncbi:MULTISPECIES: hypothetical protein [unclassified Prochlorococcus]|uniref:hypothetical protein n=1 Tax=unclassified Prochlorococcus TaxID=2627481 RepID=UPI00126816EB|nr:MULTISPECIES: hypothetical protein [unclassified Prochlorococcus]
MGFDYAYSNQKRSADNSSAIEKDILIDEMINMVRDSQVKNRTYKINRNSKLNTITLHVYPFELRTEGSPDWWSEKKSYDLAYLLKKSLDKYPGLKVKLYKTWEEYLINEEMNQNNSNIMKSKKKEEFKTNSNFYQKAKESLFNISNNINYFIKRDEKENQEILQPKQYHLSIRPNITEYIHQRLPSKKRGIGLGFVAFNSKKCITETYFSSDYKMSFEDQPKYLLDSGNFNHLKTFEYSKSLTINKLITQTMGGSSMNVNLILGGFGGGKFKEPNKPIKKIIYQNIVDASEGIYCLITNQEECINFYKDRLDQSPTLLKIKDEKKPVDKSC